MKFEGMKAKKSSWKKNITCDIPNCKMKPLATSLFCGPHDQIKIPRKTQEILEKKELKLLKP